MTMTQTIKTTLHTYWFDTSTEEGAAGYKQLCENMEKQGIECFETFGGVNISKGGHYAAYKKINGQVIELETKHIFNNQWNTAPITGFSESGIRVFDWAQDYLSAAHGMNPLIKMGHYLEMTQEMRDLRNNTLICGYCGHQEPLEEAKSQDFCSHCLGSEYLSEYQINLTRLQPVFSKGEREPLTEEESQKIMPLYVEAQTKMKAKQAEAKREKILQAYDKAMNKASNEKDGQLWLLDRGLLTDNVIYYGHQETFCFGWRNPMSDAVKAELEKQLADFPFNYSFK